MRNIIGDRAIEWDFVQDNMPMGPGNALDFGPGGSTLASLAIQKDFTVMAVDLDDTDWKPQDGVTFVHGDIFEVALPCPFDLVIACSTLEHVGIPGRYGVTDRYPNDLDAMELLDENMAANATMLLTVPMGEDMDFTPLCRVYGVSRLPRLLANFHIEKENYWVKNSENVWIPTDSVIALSEKTHVYSWDPAENYYALGCFVLRVT